MTTLATMILDIVGVDINFSNLAIIRGFGGEKQTILKLLETYYTTSKKPSNSIAEGSLERIK